MANEEIVYQDKQTCSFKLSKMSKGYNWEIKIYDDNLEALKKKTAEMDDWANTEYGGKTDEAY